MSTREKGGRVVFIGNIPYGISEEQICDIFGRCGQVLSFRLVYDKETGRPKGFGFLEFSDVDAAAAAVRNLNDYDLNGRTLRVDYSNENDKGRGGTSGTGGGAGAGGAGGITAQAPAFPIPGSEQVAHANPSGDVPGALPSLPQGVELPPGITAPDAISQTLGNIPPAQLIDIISQMKTMVHQNPAQATALLASSPQLSYAIFQALLLLGVVGTDVLASLIQSTQQVNPAQQPVAYAPPPPAPQQQPQQQQHYPPQPSYPPQGAYGMPQGYAATPPQQQPAYAPPPQATAPAAAAAPQVNPAVVQQVLGLTREQIFSLPDDARDQVIALRAQFGAPV